MYFRSKFTFALRRNMRFEFPHFRSLAGKAFNFLKQYITIFSTRKDEKSKKEVVF